MNREFITHQVWLCCFACEQSFYSSGMKLSAASRSFVSSSSLFPLSCRCRRRRGIAFLVHSIPVAASIFGGISVVVGRGEWRDSVVCMWEG